MHTEEQVRKLWCPFVSCVVFERQSDAKFGPFNRMMDADTGGSSGPSQNSVALNCIASECAAWRWSDPETAEANDDRESADLLGRGYEFTHEEGYSAGYGPMKMKIRADRRTGYCGLAGKPS